MEGLELFDLSEKERLLLKIIFSEGIIGASDLAELAKIKRGSIYLYLENIKQKSLIIEVLTNDKTYYKPQTKLVLEKLIQQKINQLKKLKKSLPKLIKKTKKPNKTASSISVYKGISAVHSVLLEASETTEEACFMGSVKRFYQFVPAGWFDKAYNKKRRNKVLTTDYLIADWAERTIHYYYSDSGTFTKRRFLPPDLNVNGGLAIYGSKIAIGTFKKEPEVVVIEEESLAKLFKLAFTALFDSLEGQNIPPKP